MYTVPVSIIDASAPEFRLAYIDTLSFSFVSLMLADAKAQTRLNCIFTQLNLSLHVAAAATTTAASCAAN